MLQGQAPEKEPLEYCWERYAGLLSTWSPGFSGEFEGMFEDAKAVEPAFDFSTLDFSSPDSTCSMNSFESDAKIERRSCSTSPGSVSSFSTMSSTKTSPTSTPLLAPLTPLDLSDNLIAIGSRV